jgi:sphingomyelin phosphodiesterase
MILCIFLQFPAFCSTLLFDNYFQLYYKYYWKASPVRPQCDKECKKRLLCDLVSSRSHDRKQTCVMIEQRMDEQTGGWKTWLVNGLTIT